MGVDSLDKTRFCFSLGHPSLQQLLLLVLPPIHLWPSHTFCDVFSHQRGEGNEQGGGASLDLIGCSELNWDRGCINCGASSYVGVDSLDKTRFCFALGHHSLLLLLTIHATSSAPARETFQVVTTSCDSIESVFEIDIHGFRWKPVPPENKLR